MHPHCLFRACTGIAFDACESIARRSIFAEVARGVVTCRFMERRAFLTLGAGTAAGWLRGPPNANAAAPPQPQIRIRESHLGLSEWDQDGPHYVAKGYIAAV